MNDETAMRKALALARRAAGRSFPNPAVGAVVFRGGRILGRGFTRPAGGPHAEIVALARARRLCGARALRGAALAVTLEPCCHTGRTGPCTEAVIAAGIRHVIVGIRDPHSPVNGRGLRALRRAGIAVEVGVLADACREHHRGFLSVVERGRPWVELKLASSLDGRIAAVGGASRWITGAAARTFAHRLRAGSDAILVGANTVLTDDPELLARRRDRVIHRPVRVVVDSRLRVPPTARVWRGALERGDAWVLCGPRPPSARRRRLERNGVRVFPLPRAGTGVDLRAGLRRLAREGVTQVLVEGGGEIAASLLRAGLVDSVHWFAAPLFLGGDAVPALGRLGQSSVARSLALLAPEVHRLGCDLYLRGRVGRRGESA